MSVYIPILLRIANGLDNIAKAIDRYTDTSCPDLFRELEKQENRKERSLDEAENCFNCTHYIPHNDECYMCTEYGQFTFSKHTIIPCYKYQRKETENG